jgi:hypothetical protein
MKSALCLLALTLVSASAYAAAITGTVTNKTTNKPAAGDQVTLIRLSQGMQESTKTKTDAHGHFSLDVPDPGGIHLVRVTHDKANYFQPVDPSATNVDVDVYTAEARVVGVTGEADVLKIQTDPSGAQLDVIEMFFVKNDSAPPKTQFSDRPFEFYLPAGAVVDSSVALGPGGMPVRSAPVPLGDPNHYAFIFPLRPGESRFQVSYKLPYKGSFSFTPHPILPTDTIALVMPKSMKFDAPAASPYAAVTEETTAQAYAARNVTPQQPLGFSISGTGALPRDQEAAAPSGPNAGPNSGPNASGDATPAATSDTRPGGGLGVPVDPTGNNDPWAKYKWWIIGGLGLLLAAGAGFMLKSPAPLGEGAPTPPTPGYNTQTASFAAANPAYANIPGNASAAAPTAAQASPTPSNLLTALRDELFALETDRIQNRISAEAYLEQKTALETVLRRALTRTETT